MITLITLRHQYPSSVLFYRSHKGFLRTLDKWEAFPKLDRRGLELAKYNLNIMREIPYNRNNTNKETPESSFRTRNKNKVKLNCTCEHTGWVEWKALRKSISWTRKQDLRSTKDWIVLYLSLVGIRDVMNARLGFCPTSLKNLETRRIISRRISWPCLKSLFRWHAIFFVFNTCVMSQ